MHITEKSELNAKAADTLIASGLYAPSIHCMYYACYQMSMRILKNHGVDYATQNEEARAKKQDSHNYTIGKVGTVVSDQSTYSRCMRKLKRLRKKADYENASIVPLEASDAYSCMQNVLSMLVP